MISVKHASVLPTEVIDAIAKTIGAIGVSTGPYGTAVHVADDTSNDDLYAISDALNGYGTLPVSADKTTMTEGDADPVISCNDAAIAGDSDVGYVALLDGGLYDSGVESVVGGAVNLTLGSPVDGVYDIYIFRRSGNYASGGVTITVSEA